MKRLCILLIFLFSSLVVSAQGRLGAKAGTLGFSIDSNKLSINDTVTLYYQVYNSGNQVIKFGKSIYTNIKVLSAGGSRTINKFNTQPLPVPLDTDKTNTASIYFQIQLGDTLFSEGPNTIIIWPSGDSLLATQDSIKYVLSLPSVSGPDISTDTASVKLSNKDTSKLKLGDSLDLSYKVQNTYNRTLYDVQYYSRMRVINQARDSILPQHFGQALVPIFGPQDTFRLSLKLRFTTGLFEKGHNIVVIWPESNVALRSDSLYLSFRIDDGSNIRDLSYFVSHVRFYPNPSEGRLYLQHDAGAPRIKDVNIYSLEGRKVWQGPAEEHLDISGLAAGSYIVELRYADGSLQRQKLIRK